MVYRGTTHLKAVRPDQIEQMEERVFVSETSRTESEMLDDTSACLPVHGISVRKCVFQAGHHTMDVVFAHFANVLEEERHSLQTSVSDVQVGRAVLVEDCRDTGERSTRFLRNRTNGHQPLLSLKQCMITYCNNSNSDCRAHSRLSVLNPQIG